MLPETRDVTFDGVKPLPEDTANRIQDLLVALWNKNGRPWRLDCYSDFLGDQISREMFEAPPGGAVILADSGLGASGSVFVASNNVDSILQTKPMTIGLNDFRLIARSRPAAGFAGVDVYFGLRSATAAEQVWFESLGMGNWFVRVGVGAPVDTGVAYTEAHYKSFKIERRGGFLICTIDGVPVHSQAFAQSIATGRAHLRANDPGATGSVTSIAADYIRVSADLED